VIPETVAMSARPGPSRSGRAWHHYPYSCDEKYTKLVCLSKLYAQCSEGIPVASGCEPGLSAHVAADEMSDTLQAKRSTMTSLPRFNLVLSPSLWLNWSRWRRRHQSIVQACRYRRRAPRSHDHEVSLEC